MLDRAFHDIILECECDVLIECGAHEASASIAFCNDGKRKAIAVEANPQTFREKTVLSTAFGVIALNLGLGSTRGTSEFFVPKHEPMSGSASFLKKREQDVNSVKVEMATVDIVASENVSQDAKIALWIDVEGHTAEVLAGSKHTLTRCAALKIEVESVPQWEQQSSVLETDLLLHGAGFIPILRDFEYETQYNLIYVRKDLIHTLDQLIITKWSELAAIRVTKREIALRNIRNSVSRWKGRISDGRGSIVIHAVAAAFGSKSSRAYLRDRRAHIEMISSGKSKK